MSEAKSEEVVQFIPHKETCSLSHDVKIVDEGIPPSNATTNGSSTMDNDDEQMSSTGCCKICSCKRDECFREGFSAACIGNFIADNFLPIGLIFFCALGIIWPTPGSWINHPATSYTAVIGIFLISGLFLKTNEIRDALKSYLPVLWGVVSILFVTSSVGVSLIGVLPYDDQTYKVANGSRIPEIKKGVFGANEFQRGLQIYFSAPCTVSSGVIMVSQLGGNNALALFLTVTCNLLSTFTMPPLMNWLVKLEGDIKLDIGKLIMKLSITILLPTLVGKTIQHIKQVNKVSLKYKRPLKLLSIFLLLLLPWMKVSEAKKSGKLNSLSVVVICLTVLTAAVIHISFLIINRLACFVLRFDVSQTKCVVILASQKTLAISLSVINFLPPEAGSKGLLSLPLLLAHFTIIIMDSILVVVWAKFSPVREETLLLQNDKGERRPSYTENKNETPPSP